MPTESRPNFFIVGAQKSGTSALSAWLARHPEVFMSFPKEPGYLAFGEDGYPYKDGYGRQAPASDYVVDSEVDYLALFSGRDSDQRIAGESSTWYFALPGMATRIKRYSPDARVLVILRNPADRAYSAWSHARRDGLEPCDDFRQALQREEERGEVEFLLRYHRMGMYSSALQEYLSVFGTSRLMVLFYEELSDDQVVLWARLCKFLGIDPDVAPPPQSKRNRSGNPRSRILQNILGSYRTRVLAKRYLPGRLSAGAKEKLDRLNLRKPEGLDNSTREYLKQYYRDDIQGVMDLTGADLHAWLE